MCCGAGGWSEGLRQAGLTPVLGVDSWNIAIQSYHDNFPEAKKLIKKIENLTADDLPDAEVIVGSPPCQKASKARAAREEPQWEILRSIIDLIDVVKPEVWVMENVLEYWNMMPKELRERIPRFELATACHYGLHHIRKRVFFGDFPKPQTGYQAPVLFWTPRASEHKMAAFQTKGNVLAFYEYLGGRSPTPTEMLWAMGFPPGYRLAGTRIDKITQAGNAVCPPVARAFGLAIMQASTATSQEK